MTTDNAVEQKRRKQRLKSGKTIENQLIIP
jgi:hypothetical protein